MDGPGVFQAMSTGGTRVIGGPSEGRSVVWDTLGPNNAGVDANPSDPLPIWGRQGGGAEAYGSPGSFGIPAGDVLIDQMVRDRLRKEL